MKDKLTLSSTGGQEFENHFEKLHGFLKKRMWAALHQVHQLHQLYHTSVREGRGGEVWRLSSLFQAQVVQEFGNHFEKLHDLVRKGMWAAPHQVHQLHQLDHTT